MEPPQPPLPRPQKQTNLSRTTTTNILLNKYELGTLLGRGSFAKVYAARPVSTTNTTYTTNDKVVAIKVIEKTKTNASFLEQRLVSEVKAMHKLQHHPNILKIHEVMATKTKIFLVMELAPKGDLFTKIIQRGRLNEAATCRYFHQIVSAVHFCHVNGVSHRDLKPHNLLLDGSNNLKISDFGLSSLRHDAVVIKNEQSDACSGNNTNVLLQTACGTPAFTAPEVFSRRGYDGAKADAWSCGVILYFLLSGSLPFDDSNLVTMYKKIYKREYQIPYCISRQARVIINQLLDPNPKMRLGVESLLNHSWLVNKTGPSPISHSDSSSSLLGLDFNYLRSKYNFRSGIGVNAFHIISLSSALDLSGLFKGGRSGKRFFTSEANVDRVRDRVKEVGRSLGYGVEEFGDLKGGGGVVVLAKENVVLVFEAMQVAEKLVVVEVKAVERVGDDGGGGEEFEEVCWVELKDGFRDIVLQ